VIFKFFGAFCNIILIVLLDTMEVFADIGSTSGTIVIDANGNIVTSSGDFDQTMANALYNMALDTNSMLVRSKAGNFKRLTIAYNDYEVVMVVKDNKIYAVKKPN